MVPQGRDRGKTLLDVLSITIGAGVFLCDEGEEETCLRPERTSSQCSRLALLAHVASCAGHPACCAIAAILTQVLLRQFLASSKSNTDWSRPYVGVDAHRGQHGGANKREAESGVHEATKANESGNARHKEGETYRDGKAESSRSRTYNNYGAAHEDGSPKQGDNYDAEAEHEDDASETFQRHAGQPTPPSPAEKLAAVSSTSALSTTCITTQDASKASPTPCLFTLLRTAALIEEGKGSSTCDRDSGGDTVPWRAFQEDGDEEEDTSEGTTTETRSDRDAETEEEAAKKGKESCDPGDTIPLEPAVTEEQRCRRRQDLEILGDKEDGKAPFHQQRRCHTLTKSERQCSGHGDGTQKARSNHFSTGSGFSSRENLRPHSLTVDFPPSSCRHARSSDSPPSPSRSWAVRPSRLVDHSCESSPASSTSVATTAATSAAPVASSRSPPSACGSTPLSPGSTVPPVTRMQLQRASRSFREAAHELRKLLARCRCPFMPSVILAATHVALFSAPPQPTGLRSPRRGPHGSRWHCAGEGNSRAARHRAAAHGPVNEGAAAEEGDLRRPKEDQVEEGDVSGDETESSDSKEHSGAGDERAGASRRLGLAVVLDTLLHAREFWKLTAQDVDILRFWAASPTLGVARRVGGEKQLFLACLNHHGERLSFFQNILDIPSSPCLPLSPVTPSPTSPSSSSSLSTGEGFRSSQPPCPECRQSSPSLSLATVESYSQVASASTSPCLCRPCACLACSPLSSPISQSLSFSFTPRKEEHFPLLPFVVAFLLPIRHRSAVLEHEHQAECTGEATSSTAAASGHPSSLPFPAASSPLLSSFSGSALPLPHFLVACVAATLRRKPRGDCREEPARHSGAEEGREPWYAPGGEHDSRARPHRRRGDERPHEIQKTMPFSFGQTCTSPISHQLRVSSYGCSGLLGGVASRDTRNCMGEDNEKSNEGEGGSQQPHHRRRCCSTKRHHFGVFLPACFANILQARIGESNGLQKISPNAYALMPSSRSPSSFLVLSCSASSPHVSAGCPLSHATLPRSSALPESGRPRVATRRLAEASRTSQTCWEAAAGGDTREAKDTRYFQEREGWDDEEQDVLFRLFLRLLPTADGSRSPLHPPSRQRLQIVSPRDSRHEAFPSSWVASAVHKRSEPSVGVSTFESFRLPSTLASVSSSPSSAVPQSPRVSSGSLETRCASLGAENALLSSDSAAGSLRFGRPEAARLLDWPLDFLRPLQSLRACAAWLEQRHDEAPVAGLAGLFWLCWAEQRHRARSQGDGEQAMRSVGEQERRRRGRITGSGVDETVESTEGTREADQVRRNSRGAKAFEAEGNREWTSRNERQDTRPKAGKGDETSLPSADDQVLERSEERGNRATSPGQEEGDCRILNCGTFRASSVQTMSDSELILQYHRRANLRKRERRCGSSSPSSSLTEACPRRFVSDSCCPRVVSPWSSVSHCPSLSRPSTVLSNCASGPPQPPLSPLTSLSASWDVSHGGRTCLWASAVSLSLLHEWRRSAPFTFPAVVLPEAFLVTVAQNRERLAAPSLGKAEPGGESLELQRAPSMATPLSDLGGEPPCSRDAGQSGLPAGTPLRREKGTGDDEKVKREDEEICRDGQQEEVMSEGEAIKARSDSPPSPALYRLAWKLREGEEDREAPTREKSGEKESPDRRFCIGRCRGEGLLEEWAKRHEWRASEGMQRNENTRGRGQEEAGGKKDGKKRNVASGGKEKRDGTIEEAQYGSFSLEKEELDALRFCWLHLLRAPRGEKRANDSDRTFSSSCVASAAWRPVAAGGSEGSVDRSDRGPVLSRRGETETRTDRGGTPERRHGTERRGDVCIEAVSRSRPQEAEGLNAGHKASLARNESGDKALEIEQNKAAKETPNAGHRRSRRSERSKDQEGEDGRRENVKNSKKHEQARGEGKKQELENRLQTVEGERRRADERERKQSTACKETASILKNKHDTGEAFKDLASVLNLTPRCRVLASSCPLTLSIPAAMRSPCSPALSPPLASLSWCLSCSEAFPLRRRLHARCPAKSPQCPMSLSASLSLQPESSISRVPPHPAARNKRTRNAHTNRRPGVRWRLAASPWFL
uniref:Uncharacterized protein n=1 Tax=Toxoplasma gondii (strain ATCC 50861 / VEG) TaxID=432359 RepID=A0A0F7UZF1_TOXGV|nr:TPA: hypothetical protein BN1205_016190 [Toxoplasma gondii VEG]